MKSRVSTLLQGGPQSSEKLPSCDNPCGFVLCAQLEELALHLHLHLHFHLTLSLSLKVTLTSCQRCPLDPTYRAKRGANRNPT